MKVAHVVINGEVAGGQVIAGRIIAALCERGDRAILISSGRGPFTEKLERDNIPVYLVPFRKTYHIHHVLRLLKIFRNEKVDIVHTHGMLPVNIPSRLASKLAGIPCFSHIHIANVFSQNPLLARYQLFLDRWTARFCHQLIAVSQATKESLIREKIASERIEVIPNGIDFRKAAASTAGGREARARFGISSEQPVVGMVGRLCPVKGQSEFLKLFALVLREIPEARGVIVGCDTEFRGHFEERLRGEAKALGLNGHIVFAGYQPDPFSLMAAMDVFVLPSRAEGLPLVLLEAMALKRPVVASSVDGISEVIQHGTHGFLFSPDQTEQMAQAVIQLLRDPSLRSQVGEAGFQKVQTDFTESRMLNRILKLYDEALAT